MKRNKIFLGLIILVLALVALALYMVRNPKLQVSGAVDYDDCVNKGGRIMESYPERCAFNGVTFSNPNQKVETPPTTEKPQTEPQTATGPDLSTKLVADTSAWETFTNNTRGYSIKYPADWILETVNLDATAATEGRPVRYLKLTSPNKKYLLTVGIKKTSEDVALNNELPDYAGSDPVVRGTLQATGISFPITATYFNNEVSSISYYDVLKGGLGLTVRDYVIRAELTRLTADAAVLDQAPELAIANSILASLTLTK